MRNNNIKIRVWNGLRGLRLWSKTNQTHGKGDVLQILFGAADYITCPMSIWTSEYEYPSGENNEPLSEVWTPSVCMPEFGSEQDVGLGRLHPVVWVSYLRGWRMCCVYLRNALTKSFDLPWLWNLPIWQCSAILQQCSANWETVKIFYDWLMFWLLIQSVIRPVIHPEGRMSEPMDGFMCGLNAVLMAIQSDVCINVWMYELHAGILMIQRDGFEVQK